MKQKLSESRITRIARITRIFCVFVIRVRSVVKYALGNLGEKSIDFSSLSVMRFKRLL